MPRNVDCNLESRLLCPIGIMKFTLSIPVLITVRMAMKAKRGPNLRRVEH
jgi:hypothetical protein